MDSGAFLSTVPFIQLILMDDIDQLEAAISDANKMFARGSPTVPELLKGTQESAFLAGIVTSLIVKTKGV